MKILRFSFIVVGVHLLALIVIFANPGCSSSAKPQPSAGDTATKSDGSPAAPVSSVTSTDAGTAPSSGATGAPAAISFNQDSVRYSPTRPGTPAATVLQVEPLNNVTPASTYTIVTGDNLSTIAKKNHLTVAELAAANNLNAATAKIHPGQKLIIPSKAPAPAKTTDASAALHPTSGAPMGTAELAAAKPGAEVVKHTVKARETLSAIAAKYGVKQGAIADANNITDPQKIRPGMELIIPGWQAPGSKTKSAPTSAKGESSSPAYNPGMDAARTATPPPSAEVPVIQVEEAPAPTK